MENKKNRKESVIVGSNRFIETFPGRIILIKVIDQNFYEGRLKIVNVTDKNVIYKFNITQHMIYTVSPSVYVIKPFEHIVVNIKRFEKVTIDQLKQKEGMQIFCVATDQDIQDINDAKNYIKKEDVYSPHTQQLTLEVEFDNGNNLSNYQNMINERITIAQEYNQQLNMNNVNTIEEVNKHIADVKKEIEEKQILIEELLAILKDISTKNLVKPPQIYFDKEEFEKEVGINRNCIIPDNFPVFVVVFMCCVGLLIGKFLVKFFN